MSLLKLREDSEMFSQPVPVLNVLLSLKKLLFKSSFDFNLGFFPIFYKICQNQSNIFESFQKENLIAVFYLVLKPRNTVGKNSGPGAALNSVLEESRELILCHK